MLNVATSRDYLKYTLTLAGAGFAYGSSTLADKTAIFGLGTTPILGEMTSTKLVVGLLLAAFLASTIFGVFALSGTVRYENEMTKVPVPRAGAAVPSDEAKKALNATVYYANLHLKSLIGAFIASAFFFVEEFVHLSDPLERCQMEFLAAGSAEPAVRIEFDCSAEVAAAVAAQGGSVTQ